jgi:hypothetical protein
LQHFLLLVKFHQKDKFEIAVILEVLNHQKWRGKNSTNHQIFIFGFQCEAMIKDLYFMSGL